MITDYSQIQKLFAELDGHVTERTVVYMIGGGALMKRKMKAHTKDVDIVVDTKAEYDSMQHAFRTAGFKPDLPTEEYDRLELLQIWKREDYRVDLFCKKVCRRFSLSKNMMERSLRDDIQTKNIELRVCSPEDIFVFKTMTEREGDYDDCASILRRKTDFGWSVVLNEAQEQSEDGLGVWITWITARLEKFAEKGMNIPILDEMIKLTDKYIAEWEQDLMARNPEKFCSR